MVSKGLRQVRLYVKCALRKRAPDPCDSDRLLSSCCDFRARGGVAAARNPIWRAIGRRPNGPRWSPAAWGREGARRRPLAGSLTHLLVDEGVLHGRLLPVLLQQIVESLNSKCVEGSVLLRCQYS